jgi:hypothetical protein
MPRGGVSFDCIVGVIFGKAGAAGGSQSGPFRVIQWVSPESDLTLHQRGAID